MVRFNTSRTARTDHPREYGENTRTIATYTYGKGSSPRIRGESGTGDPVATSDRIIPANTGRIVFGHMYFEKV